MAFAAVSRSCLDTEQHLTPGQVQSTGANADSARTQACHLETSSMADACNVAEQHTIFNSVSVWQQHASAFFLLQVGDGCFAHLCKELLKASSSSSVRFWSVTSNALTTMAGTRLSTGSCTQCIATDHNGSQQITTDRKGSQQIATDHNGGTGYKTLHPMHMKWNSRSLF